MKLLATPFKVFFYRLLHSSFSHIYTIRNANQYLTIVPVYNLVKLNDWDNPAYALGYKILSFSNTARYGNSIALIHLLIANRIIN